MMAAGRLDKASDYGPRRRQPRGSIQPRVLAGMSGDLERANKFSDTAAGKGLQQAAAASRSGRDN